MSMIKQMHVGQGNLKFIYSMKENTNIYNSIGLTSSSFLAQMKEAFKKLYLQMYFQTIYLKIA